MNEYDDLSRAKISIPEGPIPLYYEMNGKKYLIGSGTVDRETMVFSAGMDPDSPVVAMLKEDNVLGFSLGPVEIAAVSVARVIAPDPPEIKATLFPHVSIHSIGVLVEHPDSSWGIHPIEIIKEEEK